MTASKARTEAQEMVLEWFDIDPSWGNKDTDFYASYPTFVEGKRVARPFYLFFGQACLFLDAPFSRVNEIDEILAKPTAWGIGRVGGAYTYHNVLMYDMILSNPVATQNLIEIFASEAGRKEFEVSGRISFVIDTKDEPEKGSLFAGTSASLRISGEAVSTESPGRRSAMQYGQPKGKRF